MNDSESPEEKYEYDPYYGRKIFRPISETTPVQDNHSVGVALMGVDAFAYGNYSNLE